MTSFSHIAFIEYELDGFHQSLAEYCQQMGARYSRASDSGGHVADLPSPGDGIGDQTTQFNLRPIERPRNGKVIGAKTHYYFREKQ